MFRIVVRRYIGGPFALGVLAATLAACAGGATHSAVPPIAAPLATQSGETQVTFRIDVPKTGAAVDRRSAQYISPATTQMLIDIKENSVEVTGYPKTVSLTPTSGGCTSTLASTNCQLTVSLSQGSNYTATLTTEDASGNALSSAQMIAFTVGSSASTVAIALSGIPHTILVSSGAIAVHGSASAGFTLYGSAAQPLIVTALDADGDTIVGPGAPTFTTSANLSGSTGWSATAPTTTAPNTLTITPSGTNDSGATFSVTAVYSDSTCSTTGAVCSATYTIKNDIQTLFVSDQGTNQVTVISSPYTGATSTLSESLFSVPNIALDSANNLFVANGGNDTIYEFAPPYTGTPSTFTSSSVNSAMVFTPGNNLLTAQDLTNDVAELSPPYTGSPVTIAANGPVALALSPTGELFVASGYTTNTVLALAPPYTGTPTVMSAPSNGSTMHLAADGVGDVFIATWDSYEVDEYAPPYTGSPTMITSNVSMPWGLAIDPAGNLFVANTGSNTVTEYAPPYTGNPLVTVTNGIDNPEGIAVDGAGNLIVANNYGNNVTVYAPPYTGAPIATVSSGINGPVGLAITP